MEIRLLGATGVTRSPASVFATVSCRGTEILRTGTAHAAATPRLGDGTIDNSGAAGGAVVEPGAASWESGSIASAVGGAPRHVWAGGGRNACVAVPLPEESWERRAVEVEVDVWEAGEAGGEGGRHLGKVGTGMRPGSVGRAPRLGIRQCDRRACIVRWPSRMKWAVSWERASRGIGRVPLGCLSGKIWSR